MVPVTFIVFAYNQERFIREAIEGAFAQAYQPLKIILSDDCSTDRTFAIMQEMAGQYSGPHELSLNRNRQNLGIAGHLNRLMELCSTDFVVIAAGDDISLPERTGRLVDSWLESSREAKSIHSSATCIDSNSRDLGREYHGPEDLGQMTPEAYIERRGWVLGAAHGWDMDLFRRFGPLISGVVHEDDVLAFRALLVGTIHYIPEPLVRYRVDSGFMASARTHDLAHISARPVSALRARYRTYVQMRHDLRLAGNDEACRTALRKSRTRVLTEYWMARKGRLSPARWRLFRQEFTARQLGAHFLRYRMPRLFGRLQAIKSLGTRPQGQPRP